MLDDADFEGIMPLVLHAGFASSGRTCIAGTRILLVPRQGLAAFERVAREAVSHIKSGDPCDVDTVIGPMVSAWQWERVQNYIPASITVATAESF